MYFRGVILHCVRERNESRTFTNFLSNWNKSCLSLFLLQNRLVKKIMIVISWKHVRWATFTHSLDGQCCPGSSKTTWNPLSVEKSWMRINSRGFACGFRGSLAIPGQHWLQVVCRESMNVPSKVFSTFCRVLGPQFGHVLCLQAKSRFPNRIRRAERLLLFTGERISLWNFN